MNDIKEFKIKNSKGQELNVCEGKDTDNLSEGTTNLYFTTTRARASFTAGTGVTITDGEIAIGQDVATDSNVNFNRITSSEDIRFDGTTSRFRSDTSFDFLFIDGNAQSLKTLGVAAQTTYSGNSASSGMFNALNGYAVGTGSGTTVIDSSRNLFSEFEIKSLSFIKSLILFFEIIFAVFSFS